MAPAPPCSPHRIVMTDCYDTTCTTATSGYNGAGRCYYSAPSTPPKKEYNWEDEGRKLVELYEKILRS